MLRNSNREIQNYISMINDEGFFVFHFRSTPRKWTEGKFQELKEIEEYVFPHLLNPL